MDLETVRDNLSISYGFRVPLSFARLVIASQKINLEEALETMLGIGEEEWTRPAWRAHAMLGYHTFQPEFFCILHPGVDGIDQGLVVHAPEIPQEEYPLFECDPSGFSGDMAFLGADLRTGLEMLVAHQQGFREDALGPLTENTAYVALAEELHLSLERKTLTRLTAREHCYVPPIPVGWKFEKCGDMVGALAPAELFTGEERGFAHFLNERNGDAEAALKDLVEHAHELLQQGYFGSALLAIRRAWLNDRGNFDPDRLALWADIYRALGRPPLERVVRAALLRQGRLSG